MLRSNLSLLDLAAILAGACHIPIVAIYFTANTQTFPEAMMNIKQALEDAANEIPDKDAIVSGAKRMTLSLIHI